MLTYREFCEQMMPGVSDGNLLSKKYGDYFRENAQVGDGVTVHLWTDAHAYTIIRRTAKTLTLRRCKATRANGFKPDFIPGGFSAVCLNNEDQEWEYDEDLNGKIVQAHWSQRKHGFYVNRELIVTPGRNEFYDYNM